MEHKGLVLLVEDDSTILRGTKGMLELEDYTVRDAVSIAQARAVLAEAEPDAILLDVSLPDGDGLDFCGAIRGETGAKICILTAGGLKESDPRYLDSGADHLIPKPYNFSDLFLWLEEALRDRNSTRKQE